MEVSEHYSEQKPLNGHKKLAEHPKYLQQFIESGAVWNQLESQINKLSESYQRRALISWEHSTERLWDHSSGLGLSPSPSHELSVALGVFSAWLSIFPSNIHMPLSRSPLSSVCPVCILTPQYLVHMCLADLIHFESKALESLGLLNLKPCWTLFYCSALHSPSPT